MTATSAWPPTARSAVPRPTNCVRPSTPRTAATPPSDRSASTTRRTPRRSPARSARTRSARGCAATRTKHAEGPSAARRSRLAPTLAAVKRRLSASDRPMRGPPRAPAVVCDNPSTPLCGRDGETEMLRCCPGSGATSLCGPSKECCDSGQTCMNFPTPDNPQNNHCCSPTEVCGEGNDAVCCKVATGNCEAGKCVRLISGNPSNGSGAPSGMGK